MSAAVGKSIAVSADAAIFLDYPKFQNSFSLRLIQILGGELAVWMQCNRKKYDKANVTDKDVQRLFKHYC